MRNGNVVTEADILAEVVAPDRGSLNAAAARALLELKFPARTTKRIRQLLVKNNRGAIKADEQAVLEKYLRVGQFLDLVQAKARLSLRRAVGSS